MSEYKMNRVQLTVLISVAVITVATITAGILMRVGKEGTEFKPLESFPPSNVAIQNDVSKTGDSIKLDSESSQPETDSTDETATAPELKDDTASMQATENIPKQEVVQKPATESQLEPENVQKPAIQPAYKPSDTANDMPKDRPDSKPSTSKGGSKLVSDSENPFKQPPIVGKDSLGHVNGSDFGDGEWGTGDKF